MRHGSIEAGLPTPPSYTESRDEQYLTNTRDYVPPSKRRKVCFEDDCTCPERLNLDCLQSRGQLMSIQGLLSLPLEEIISEMDQLKLAQRVGSGILQYQSTSWLAEVWSLRDLWFFSSGPDVSDDTFRSLYLSKDLRNRSKGKYSEKQFDCNMVSTAFGNDNAAVAHNSLKSKALLFGIDNVLLYRLGVALLEIGYWMELDALDVVQVRSLADPKRQRPSLCPRYLAIAQICIKCSFGFGSDLEKVELQNAVQGQVIGELEELIGCMDIKD